MREGTRVAQDNWVASVSNERYTSNFAGTTAVQEGADGLVAPFHASFPDYLLQCNRSKMFHCNAAQHHELLANGCFDVMKAQLRFNICNLESSFVFDKDVPDLEDRVRRHISPALSYACRYWSAHLQKSNSSEAVHKNLDNFLRKQLLFWMEVLNLEKWILMGADILRQGQNGLKVRIPAHDLDSGTEIYRKGFSG